MKEEFNKISKLRFRDRITSSDISFIQQMHPKYCGHLMKNICWQCPNSIREALFDLLRFIEAYEIKIQNELEIEKKMLDNENQINTEQGFTEIGENDKSISKGNKIRKRSNSDEQ